jgi:hypothetical protein
MEQTTEELRAELARRECAERGHLPRPFQRMPLVTADREPAEVGCVCGAVTWVREDRPLPRMREVIIEARKRSVEIRCADNGELVQVEPVMGATTLRGLYMGLAKR